MNNQKTNNFMSYEAKSKIDKDLKERTKFDWDTPTEIIENEGWLQFGYKEIENPDLNFFTTFIEKAKFYISLWSEEHTEGYAIQYRTSYSSKSGGTNGFSLTFFYDKNGNFIKQYNY